MKENQNWGQACDLAILEAGSEHSTIEQWRVAENRKSQAIPSLRFPMDRYIS